MWAGDSLFSNAGISDTCAHCAADELLARTRRKVTASLVSVLKPTAPGGSWPWLSPEAVLLGHVTSWEHALSAVRHGVESLPRYDLDLWMNQIHLEYIRAKKAVGNAQRATEEVARLDNEEEQQAGRPAPDDSLPSIPGVLQLIPGGFVYRGHKIRLSGKPWAALRHFMQSFHYRATAAGLLKAVWEDSKYATAENVTDAVESVRGALREALRKARVRGIKDPMPSVDKGRNLAWELTIGQP